MQSRNRATTESSASAARADAARSVTASTDLYDLWLNSMLPTVDPIRATGVISSSSHQSRRAMRSGVDSERLAETLMQLGCGEVARSAVEERL